MLWVDNCYNLVQHHCGCDSIGRSAVSLVEWYRKAAFSRSFTRDLECSREEEKRREEEEREKEWRKLTDQTESWRSRDCWNVGGGGVHSRGTASIHPATTHSLPLARSHTLSLSLSSTYATPSCGCVYPGNGNYLYCQLSEQQGKTQQGFEKGSFENSICTVVLTLTEK